MNKFFGLLLIFVFCICSCFAQSETEKKQKEKEVEENYKRLMELQKPQENKSSTDSLHRVKIYGTVKLKDGSTAFVVNRFPNDLNRGAKKQSKQAFELIVNKQVLVLTDSCTGNKFVLKSDVDNIKKTENLQQKIQRMVAEQIKKQKDKKKKVEQK